jgi:hypothetical protein
MTSHFVDRAFRLVFGFPLTLYHRQLILGPAHYALSFFCLSCYRTVTLRRTEVNLQFIDTFVDTFRLLLIPQRTHVSLYRHHPTYSYFFDMNNNLEATPVFLCLFRRLRVEII